MYIRFNQQFSNDVSNQMYFYKCVEHQSVRRNCGYKSFLQGAYALVSVEGFANQENTSDLEEEGGLPPLAAQGEGSLTQPHPHSTDKWRSWGRAFPPPTGHSGFNWMLRQRKPRQSCCAGNRSPPGCTAGTWSPPLKPEPDYRWF